MIRVSTGPPPLHHPAGLRRIRTQLPYGCAWHLLYRRCYNQGSGDASHHGPVNCWALLTRDSRASFATWRLRWWYSYIVVGSSNVWGNFHDGFSAGAPPLQPLPRAHPPSLSLNRAPSRTPRRHSGAHPTHTWLIHRLPHRVLWHPGILAPPSHFWLLKGPAVYKGLPCRLPWSSMAILAFDYKSFPAYPCSRVGCDCLLMCLTFVCRLCSSPLKLCCSL